MNSGTIHSAKKATTNAVTNTIPTPRRKIGAKLRLKVATENFRAAE